MSELGKFLTRNSARIGKPLPLVHTTKAYFLKQILDEQRINVVPCDIFKESLNYFFVGRPAYKWDTNGEAAEWELPVCFIFEYDITNARRIFPFDTGAFTTRYPEYVRMMGLDKFEVSSISQAPERLIGTFFSNCRDYYMMKPRSEQKFTDEFLVDLLDAEVKALHKLWSSVGNPADDRRCTIEVQFEEALSLDNKKLLALVLPDVYFEHPVVKKFLHKTKAKAYPYAVYSLNSGAFFSQIYHNVKIFYETRGLLNV